MKDSKTLTVFTPTYNRAHTLYLGYEALLRQTCKDFVWLIVDDGSTDNTRQLVEHWIQEGKIEIRYHYQENQGMHGAHNTAYRLIDTELNTCIDSDDYMPDDAVEKIVMFWKQRGSEQYAGIIGLDYTVQGELIGTSLPIDSKDITLISFYQGGGKGDKKLVYRTDIIRKYPPYPVFSGEKYVGLAWLYSQIDKDYTLLVMNEKLCCVNYQMDGSSMNMYKQYWKNPKGFAFIRKEYMPFANGFWDKYRTNIHYVSSSIISKNPRFILESPLKVFTILAIIPGLMLYLYILYQVKTEKRLQVLSKH
ncbi:MAG: glycosyltransferase family A protein [Lachnospiraceae bacterium]